MSQTPENGEIRLEYWDCQSCGTKGILGDVYVCPGCGDARPNDVEFYLASDSPVVTDEQGIHDALAGPDWQCQYCGRLNPASAEACSHCGSIAGSSPRREVGPTVPTKQAYSTSEEARARRQRKRNQNGLPPSQALTPEQLSQGERRFPTKVVAIVLTALILAVLSYGSYALFIKTHDVSAQITSFSWSRQIDMEEYGTVREEDWSIPSGGRQVDQRSKFHHNIQVLDHYESRSRQVPHSRSVSYTYSCSKSLGNGRSMTGSCTGFKSETYYTTEYYQEPIYRTVPIYQTWYTYDIEKWYFDHHETATGTDQEPYWPKTSVDATHREGAKSETYTVNFVTDKQKQYTAETSMERWQALRVGQQVTLKVSHDGEVRSFKAKSATTADSSFVPAQMRRPFYLDMKKGAF